MEGLFPNKMRINDIKNELDEIKKWEDNTKRNN